MIDNINRCHLWEKVPSVQTPLSSAVCARSSLSSQVDIPVLLRLLVPRSLPLPLRCSSFSLCLSSINVSTSYLSFHPLSSPLLLLFFFPVPSERGKEEKEEGEKS